VETSSWVTSLTHDLHTVSLREEVLTAQIQPVEVGKRQVQETRHVSDTVRREVPHLERSSLCDEASLEGEQTFGRRAPAQGMLTLQGRRPLFRTLDDPSRVATTGFANGSR
jgi:hypothetical protein